MASTRSATTLRRGTGTEFRVNTVAANSQLSPAVAMDADGDVTFAWMSNGQDGSGYGVYVKSFTATGAEAPSLVLDLDAAAAGTGSARTAVAGGTPAPVLGADVTIAAAGVPVLTGATLRIEGPPDGAAETLALSDAALAAATAAGITAAWDAATGVLTLSGTASAAAYEAALEGVRYANAASLASIGDGIVSVQVSGGAEASQVAQATVSVARGPETPVNTFTSGSQRDPALAMDVDGDFVVTGSPSARTAPATASTRSATTPPECPRAPSSVSTPQLRATSPIPPWRWTRMATSSSRGGPSARTDRATASTRSATTLPVLRKAASSASNTFATNSQYAPAVAMDADGDFVVTWASYGQDGSSNGIYAQRYNAAGVAQSTEFLVNTRTTTASSIPL